ncbi:MAG: phosphate-binding protein [Chlorobiaceae bacterium]|jgi:phosphate transport system substrate-binding protein|nr:phosphate-binding protein [Chlorobiaceae bacterium]NTV15866.1 phosphate-binding protein [Chlorobiaceae bacterium]
MYRAALKIMGGLFILFPAFLMLNCTQRPDAETARSGNMTLALDRQFEEITASQSEMFSRYYPGAKITLKPVSSGKSLKHLLDGKVRAALISGEPEAGEDALFAQLKRPIRREPVAREALVCIVNIRNPVLTLSVNELGALFSAKGEKGATPLITADDFRLLSLLASTTGKKREELHPWACSSDSELIERVAADKRAIGVLFHSSFDAAMKMALRQGKNFDSIRILPLAKRGGGTPAYLPTQQNIFDGRYPLVTTVYYVYYPGDALAAGFGSWLGSSGGQKAFERSSLAPYRLVNRTIILK